MKKKAISEKIWLLHIISLVLVGLLLWRVETLPRLSLTLSSLTPDPSPRGEGSIYHSRGSATEELTTPLPTAGGAGGGAFGRGGGGEAFEHIEQLLKKHCVAQLLYLQHDITIEQLAQAIGTNRYYLSQYFSRQGITYNIYINSQRVNHFISLYQKVAASGQPFKVQLLAQESGFRSYCTFSRAFTPNRHHLDARQG